MAPNKSRYLEKQNIYNLHPLMSLLAFIQFVFLVVKGSKLETYSWTTKALKYLFLFFQQTVLPQFDPEK